MKRINVEAACYIAALMIDGKRFWIPMLAGKQLCHHLNHFLDSVDYALLTSKQVCQLTGNSCPSTALTRLLSEQHQAKIILFTDAFLICRTADGWIYQRNPGVSRRVFARILAKQLTTSPHFHVAFRTIATAMKKANGGLTQMQRRQRRGRREGLKARRSGTGKVVALILASCLLPLLLFPFAG